MRSLRRGLSMTQRDGGGHNGDIGPESPSPPKLPHTRPYLCFGRFISSFDFSSNFLQRSSRAVDRSKSKGLHVKRILFHFFVCFILGIFISFAAFVSIDLSKNLTLKQKSFSFEEELMENQHKISSVEKQVLVLDSSLHRSNNSVDAVAEWELKKEIIEPNDVEDLELEQRKLLIIVTPTYARPFQAYYLNRLAHTLKNVGPPLLWIVVEMHSQSTETAKLLRETGVIYRHLVCNQNFTSMRNREGNQINVALSHIEKHQLDGIVHFADDDSVYSAELFIQLRKIRRFGTWPVAVLAESRKRVSLEGPVCNGSQVIGWHSDQRSKLSRRFHVDMSGFAFNSTMLWDPKRWRRLNPEPIRLHESIKDGFQESTFIERMIEDESQIEGLPNDCSRIMVWHLHVEGPGRSYTKSWLLQKNLEVVAPLT